MFVKFRGIGRGASGAGNCRLRAADSIKSTAASGRELPDQVPETGHSPPKPEGRRPGSLIDPEQPFTNGRLREDHKSGSSRIWTNQQLCASR